MIRAICHDQTHMISGTITSISNIGCELLASSGSAAPEFPRKANILLNLMNDSTGESMNIKARLVGVRRKNGVWTYAISWDETPALLLAVAV